MSAKEVLVDRYLLYANDPYARLKLDDLVNEQKRVPVRQYSLDRYSVEYRHMGKMRLYKPKAGKQSSPAFRCWKLSLPT